MAQDLQGLLDEARGLMNDIDPDESLVTDLELTNWLNEGLAHLSLEGQLLEDLHQFQTVAGKHEYFLPYDDGDIKEVFFYTGSRQKPLTECTAMEAIRDNQQTAGEPSNYYKRMNSAYLVARDSASSITKVSRGNRAKDKQPLFIIGLFPTPSVAQTVTLRVGMAHPPLIHKRDRVLLPKRFHYGAVAWALFKCYEKEKSYAESEHYSKVFDSILGKASDASIMHGKVDFHERPRARDTYDLPEWPGRAIID